MARARIMATGTVKVDITLDRGREAVLGRGVEAQIMIDDERISRRHCSLSLTENGVIVTDLGSGNGTFVNGKQVKAAVLRTGDMLRVGGATLALRVDYAGDEALKNLSLKCQGCGRSIALTTVTDGDVIEIKKEFMCPRCAEKEGLKALTPSESVLVRRLVEDGYDVQAKLSSSGMVTIYRAVRRSTASPVAVKALQLSMRVPPEKVKRLLQEALTEAQLNHPNIVTVYDMNHQDDLLYIVMELITGTTLLRRIESSEGGHMKPKETVDVAMQLAKALEHAHGKDIIHRDVNPSNVIITEGDLVKLIDFGLAKSLSKMTALGITGEGATLGTVGYMAPEQVKTARRVDARADVYGLGATLYHCVTGKPPFSAVKEVFRVAGGAQPRGAQDAPAPARRSHRQGHGSRPEGSLSVHDGHARGAATGLPGAGDAAADVISRARSGNRAAPRG